MELVSAANSQAERKYRDHEMIQRYHFQGIGFEPLAFEYSRGLEPEESRILISLSRTIDDNLNRKIGSAYQILK